jgi:hypothetical protein
VWAAASLGEISNWQFGQVIFSLGLLDWPSSLLRLSDMLLLNTYFFMNKFLSHFVLPSSPKPFELYYVSWALLLAVEGFLSNFFESFSFSKKIQVMSWSLVVKIFHLKFLIK